MRSLELEVIGQNQETYVPKEELDRVGVGLDHPVVGKFVAVHEHMQSLRIPFDALPTIVQDTYVHEYKDGVLVEDTNFKGDRLRVGVDYFLGRYDGSPRSVKQNITSAIYHETKGVEPWRIMKSLVYKNPEGELAILHLRGDRKVDENFLKAHRLERVDDISSYGWEYGVVSPFVKKPESVELKEYWDPDLINAETRRGDDVVFTSSGVPEYYLAFDVRKYLQARFKTSNPKEFTEAFSLPDIEVPRKIAKRNIYIWTGDSTIDGLLLATGVADAVTAESVRDKVHFGDRGPAYVVRGDPRLAATMNVKEHKAELEALAETIEEIFDPARQGESPPVLLLSSIAANAAMGDILTTKEGYKYIGSKQVVESHLLALQEEGVTIDSEVLIALPSQYESGYSAFDGKILTESQQVDSDIKARIIACVNGAKAKGGNPVGAAEVTVDFYRMIEEQLKKSEKELDQMKGKNFAIVVGVSDLVRLLQRHHAQQIPKIFSVFKSSDPAAVARDIRGASPEKIRLILILSTDLLAKAAAKAVFE